MDALCAGVVGGGAVIMFALDVVLLVGRGKTPLSDLAARVSRVEKDMEAACWAISRNDRDIRNFVTDICNFEKSLKLLYERISVRDSREASEEREKRSEQSEEREAVERVRFDRVKRLARILAERCNEGLSADMTRPPAGRLLRALDRLDCPMPTPPSVPAPDSFHEAGKKLQAS